MPYLEYKPKTFRGEQAEIVAKAHAVLVDYAAQGFDLTLRQLYYQFVARGWIPNTDRDYKRLGSIVNDARLAGQIDWNHIVDRTRYVRENHYWETPADIIKAAAAGFSLDKWATQPTYVEVWVEKDALIGVVEQACLPLETSYLSCRGYVSQSEMWRAARRIGRRINDGQRVVVFHLGDHDPSGVDMSRDIRDRIFDFLIGDGHYLYQGEREEGFFSLKRIALTWEQIEEYGPPPNPAKVTDSRAGRYIDRYGNESWELDALEPRVLVELITDHVLGVRDKEAWETVEREEHAQGEVLRLTHERWDEVASFLNGKKGETE